jgi:hypothetical protein
MKLSTAGTSASSGRHIGRSYAVFKKTTACFLLFHSLKVSERVVHSIGTIIGRIRRRFFINKTHEGLFLLFMLS